jgi:hypothetical protein
MKCVPQRSLCVLRQSQRSNAQTVHLPPVPQPSSSAAASAPFARRTSSYSTATRKEATSHTTARPSVRGTKPAVLLRPLERKDQTRFLAKAGRRAMTGKEGLEHSPPDLLFLVLTSAGAGGVEATLSGCREILPHLFTTKRMYPWVHATNEVSNPVG